jgi:uncharacterized protein YdhG (YjbR/CyaY superfamily)
VSKEEIDRYLNALDEPKRATLAQWRDTIAAIVPDAEQCISYGMPAFKLHGKTIAGFAAFKSHLSYLPHSGSVISQLAKDTDGYTKTKGSLHFPVDEPLPKTLVKKLLEAGWMRLSAQGDSRSSVELGRCDPRSLRLGYASRKNPWASSPVTRPNDARSR